MILGERPRRMMEVERKYQRRVDHDEHVGDGFIYFAPVFPLLAPRHGRELVEHLHAELAAAREQRARPIALAVHLLRIDEYVGVEERAHLSLASSRSNL